MKTLTGLHLRRWLPKGSHALIGVPFLWLLVFFLLPFAIILKISFAEADIAIPPYTSLVEWADQQLTVLLNLGNYILLSEDKLYIAAYLGSVKKIGRASCRERVEITGVAERWRK